MIPYFLANFIQCHGMISAQMIYSHFTTLSCKTKIQFSKIYWVLSGYMLFFHIFALKHRLQVLIKDVLTSTHNLCFELKYEICLF